MREPAEILDRRAILGTAQLRLGELEPAGHQVLGERAGAISKITWVPSPMITAEDRSALSSTLISPALEELSDLPAGNRALRVGECPGLASTWRGCRTARDRRGVRHTLGFAQACSGCRYQYAGCSDA